MNSVIDKKAYYETYIILKNLDLIGEIPEEIRMQLINNGESDEQFSFDQNVPLFEQIDNEKTKALLSYLYLKYINKNKTEKNMLFEKYKQNEVDNQNEINEKYSTDNLFKKADISNETKEPTKETEHTELVKYNKGSIFRRIIEKIKNILRK